MIDWCLVFNATFSNTSAISWRPVLVDYPKRTTDHGQATGKLYHLRLRVECTLFVIYKAGANQGGPSVYFKSTFFYSNASRIKIRWGHQHDRRLELKEVLMILRPQLLLIQFLLHNYENKFLLYSSVLSDHFVLWIMFNRYFAYSRFDSKIISRTIFLCELLPLPRGKW